jgi:hypothetical protein
MRSPRGRARRPAACARIPCAQLACLCDAFAARSSRPSGRMRAHSMCELRTFALVSCARVARSRSPSRYVVRAAGETPAKLTLSASSATRLRHGCA